MWEGLDIEKIKKCVENKAEFDKVFPGFILEIQKNVDEKLAAEFDQSTSWFGPDGRARTMEMHPELVEPVYLDWVCFGIEGLPREDCHVGVLFDLQHWPVTYRIGIHAFSYIWEPFEAELKALREGMDTGFSYTYQPSFTEHQFNDDPKPLDFTRLEEELEGISQRVVVLYQKFNPVLKK